MFPSQIGGPPNPSHVHSYQSEDLTGSELRSLEWMVLAFFRPMTRLSRGVMKQFGRGPDVRGPSCIRRREAPRILRLPDVGVGGSFEACIWVVWSSQ